MAPGGVRSVNPSGCIGVDTCGSATKGNIVIIDWYPEKMIIASGHYPVASAQVKAMAEKCGVHAKTEFECDPYHYAIVFEK